MVRQWDINDLVAGATLATSRDTLRQLPLNARTIQRAAMLELLLG
jgi:hypothetical protein